MAFGRLGEGGVSLSHKVTKPKVDAQAVLEAIMASTAPPKGSRLPGPVQADIAERLTAGQSLSAIARALGLSRDQVRTVKFALFGVTLRQARDLKARLR